MTTKEEIRKAAPLSLFRHVFGKPDSESLSAFVAECGNLRDDSKFVEEVREYALSQAKE